MAVQASNRAQLRKDLVASLLKLPETITDGDPLFVTLSGLTASRLRADWKRGVKTTSCNSFAGWCGREAGAPAGSTLAVGKLNLSLCDNEVPGSWVWGSTGEAVDANLLPQPGDFFAKPFPGQDWGHVGVVVDVDTVGMRWQIIQGGQGGPTRGYDMITRRWEKFDRTEINGWVDIGTYILPDGPDGP